VRVVLDTNVVVAALRSSRGASHRLLRLVGTGRFELALSVPLVFEYEDVLTRLLPELAVKQEDLDAVLDYLCSVAVLQSIHYLWRPFLKDPKDDMVLELAVNAGCSHVVTFNLKDFRGSQELGVQAVPPRAFLELIGGTL